MPAQRQGCGRQPCFAFRKNGHCVDGDACLYMHETAMPSSGPLDACVMPFDAGKRIVFIALLESTPGVTNTRRIWG